MNRLNRTKTAVPTGTASALGFIGAGLLLFGIACGGQSQPSSPPQLANATVAPAASAASSQPATPQSKPATGPASSSPTLAPAAKPAAPSPSPSATVTGGRWTFDADPVGGLPSGAQSFTGQWAVRAEPDSPSPPNALCQTGQADYPAIGLDSKQYTDLTLVTHFKPISGKTDQAGGLIFRVQDKDNYYILRANALEDNVIFFTYVGAARSQLKASNAKVESGTWHELRVDVRGNAFRGFLDGKQVVDVTDDRYKSGGIGLWTKSDSVTCFDDVEVIS